MSNASALLMAALVAVLLLLYVVGRIAWTAKRRAEDADVAAAVAQHLAQQNCDRLDRAATVRAVIPDRPPLKLVVATGRRSHGMD